MKVEIKIPTMGESITEATVGEILKPSGSAVAVDEEILELETDKVNQVLYAPEGGMIELSVDVDDTVAIGQVIGYVDTAAKGGEVPQPAGAPKKVAVSAAEAEARSPKKPPGPVRRGKNVLVADLSKPVEEPEPVAAPVKTPGSAQKAAAPVGERGETRKRMTKIRRLIAQRLVEAQQTTAMLTTFNEVDLSEVMGLRSRYRDKFLNDHGVKLGFMSFFVKACVSALKAYPDINSYIDGGEIVHREYYDIGIAVGTDRGLVVPVVRDCDQKSFAEIEGAIADFGKRAREGNLAVEDLQGGGFTITNGGIYGSLLSTPILNSPQSGILGMHAIQKRPVVMDDEIVIRPMMYLALSYDHRIVDGKGAVSFLVHLKNVLEDPGRFILDV